MGRFWNHVRKVSLAKGGSWREFVLLGAPQDEEEEQRVADNCRRCPQTLGSKRSGGRQGGW